MHSAGTVTPGEPAMRDVPASTEQSAADAPAAAGHAAERDNPPALKRQVAMQAAEWFVRLHDGTPAPAERRAFEAWLVADAEHARAWQRALQISGQAGALPAELASPVLRRPRGSPRHVVRTLALLIVAAPAGWLAWRAGPWPRWTAEYATATGETRALQLADGTRVVLDTASAVDVVFDDQRRAIRLHAGAILVTTAPDARPPFTASSAAHAAPRPFVVLTAEGQVRAIGTRFTVRQEEGRSHVAVLDGAVEVTPRHAPSAARTLQAGQQASFGARAVAPAQAADAHAGQWARGVLAAENMRLADFIAELSRYRPGLIQCDPAVAELRLTGAFQLADTDAVLQNLTQLLPIQVRRRTRYWVTLVPG